VSSEHQLAGKAMLIPLSQVAAWQYSTSSSDIRRYDRQKEIRLSANVEGTSMGEANEAFFEKMESMQVPVGYKVGQAGAGNDMDDSFANMAMAVAFIFMILAAQFESYSEPFAIMFSLPLAMIGALAGLFIAGSELRLVPRWRML